MIAQVANARHALSIGNDVCDHSLLAVRLTSRVSSPLFARYDDRFLHAFMLSERAFNLTRLDAKAAYLHLLVYSPSELDVPVREVTAAISCPVNSRARALAVFISNELRRRQIRRVQISARYSFTAHADFAFKSGGQ